MLVKGCTHEPAEQQQQSCGDNLEPTIRTLTFEMQNEQLERGAYVSGILGCRTDENILEHSLLAKRAERTLNEHFCEFWSECRRCCQYSDGVLMFSDDISVWKPFRAYSATDSPVKRRRKSVFLKPTLSEDIFSLVDSHDEGHSDASSETLSLGDSSRTCSPVPTSEAALTKFIPIIDISGLYSSSYDDRLEVAMKIGAACRSAGFFYIVNHNISKDLHDNMLDQTKSFFGLSGGDKDAVSMRRLNSYRGYFRLGEEDLNQEEYRDKEGGHHKYTNGDLKEGFDIGGNTNGTSPLHAKTPFPGNDVAPEFKATTLAYYAAMTDLGRLLTQAFSLSLGLEEEYFLPFFEEDPMATLRLLHYPPKASEEADSQMGCGAHSDYGFLTLLWQDMSGGLQVWNEATSAYVDATPVRDSYVINVGDMLSRWTNGIYKSTIHRVLNKASTDRYSIPFFFNPAWDTVVDCIDVEVCRTNQKPLPATTCGDVLMDKYNTAYKKKFVMAPKESSDECLE